MSGCVSGFGRAVAGVVGCKDCGGTRPECVGASYGGVVVGGTREREGEDGAEEDNDEERG